MHTEIKSEHVKQPTQQKNPVFVFELSIVLLCSEQWLSRLGMLSAFVCLRVQRWGLPASAVSVESACYKQPKLWVMVFQPINMYNHQSSPDLMIRLEGHLCSIYCQCLVSTKKSISHSFCQQGGRAQEVLDLIYSLFSGWAGLQLTIAHYILYVHQWLFSSPAVTEVQTTPVIPVRRIPTRLLSHITLGIF